MNQQSCNDSRDQNWEFPASQNSSNFPIPDETEVSEQAKQLGQSDLSSSGGRTQSTTEIESAGMETLKQPTEQIPECDLNDRIEVEEIEESVVERMERSEGSENTFLNEMYPRGITVESFFKIVETYLPLSEDDKHQIIRGYASRGLISGDPFSTDSIHAENMTPQDNDLKDMHIESERNSEQPLQLQNTSSDNVNNFNKMADFWLNPECNEILLASQMENPGLSDNYPQNSSIQSDSRVILGDPPFALAQPYVSETKTTQVEKPKADPEKKVKKSKADPEKKVKKSKADPEKKVKKSKADPEKKVKTINDTASSQAPASKKSSPFNSSTQMCSEDESEDEFSKSQDKRESKRKSKNIRKKTLNVIKGAKKKEKASRQLTDDEILKLAFGASDIRTSFLTVVVNRMFALLKHKKFGKGFRDAIKQEPWFKRLVERAIWLETVFQAPQNSKKTLQRVEFYSETIPAAEFHGQIEELDQEVRRYEEDLYAVRQGEGEMRSKWYQEVLCWKNLQSVICIKKWAQKNRRTLPQDQCIHCDQSDKCHECHEFENLCTFLHAIYKKGIDENGQESDEIRSLEYLSKVVGNERFSEEDNVIEMDLKEFCQKAASSVMAIFLKEEERFYETAIEELYRPQRNYEKQDDGEKILCDETKKKQYLRFKSDIRERFATPEAFPAAQQKK